jgi:isoleucyl-tRNA synthetase
MSAARDGAVDIHPDGSVTLAGVTLAADEVEVQATPRPGTAVAEDDGLVMVLDTDLTEALRAEGDARELARAIQDLRRDAGLRLDDRIELWVEGLPDAVRVHLPRVLADTLAVARPGDAPPEAYRTTIALEAGAVTIALRRID